MRRYCACTSWSWVALCIGGLVALSACEGEETEGPSPTSTGIQGGGGTGASSSGGGPQGGGGTAGTGGTGSGGMAANTDPCSGNTFTPTAPLSNTGTAPASASQDQLDALEHMTDIRNLIGLNPIDLDEALNQASQAHSDYCSTDSSWCPNWHDELPGHPGFTGASFGQRCQAAGYTGSASFEVMAPGIGPVGSIDMWMATVYHRTPFVTPRIHEAGYGHGASFDTMDFGCCGPFDDSFVTNYPVHGQADVPTSWSGNEGPQPPTPPSGWPSGPVLSVIFPDDNGISVTAHEIFDGSCSPVDHLAGGADISPDPGFHGGFLGPTVVLYPNDPLTSGAEYTVNVEYTDGGSPGHRTFRFTTQ